MKNQSAGIVGGVVVGICTPIIFGALRVPTFDLQGVEILVAVLGIVVIWYGAVTAHEAGHVLAGLAAGFRPFLVVIGPLKFERPSDRWQLHVNRFTSWFGGLAVGLPISAERLRQRLLLMIVGGPVASAVATILGLIVFLLIRPDGVDISVDGWSALPLIWCLAFGSMSLFLLVLSLIPTHHEGFASDGGRILQFIKRGDDVDADVAVLTLCSASMAGQRPREWNEAVVARAQCARPDSPRGVAGAYFAHWHALDSGDLVTARARLAAALEHCETAPSMTRAAIAIQAAKFHAAFDWDPATAREWLSKAAPMTVATDAQRLIAEATIAAVERAPGAPELIARAAAELGRSQDRGCAAMDLELLERFRAPLAVTT